MSLTERLRGPLRLSGVDSIVTPSSRVRKGRQPRSCVPRTCQVGLERSHLVDYEGNTAL